MYEVFLLYANRTVSLQLVMNHERFAMDCTLTLYRVRLSNCCLSVI